MFPIRDHNPSLRTPFVTYALLAANVLIFLSYVNLFSNPSAINQFFFDWGLVPAKLFSGFGYSGFLTSMFLHGGWMHLIGNMVFLWVFGDNLEDELGHTRFLGFYLLGGIAAALAQVIVEPFSRVPMVGASGAIAAVLGGYMLLFPKARVDVLFIFVIIFRIIPIPAGIVLGVWFGLQLFSGVGYSSAGGGVAYWAHAGGFVAGMLMILPLWVARGGPAFWRRTHGHPDHPEARYRFARSSIPRVPRRRR